MRNVPVLLLLCAPLLACNGGKALDSACTDGGSGTLDVHTDDFDAAWLVDPTVDVYDSTDTLVGTFSESGTSTLPSGTYTVAVRRGVAAPDDFAGSTSGLLHDTISAICVPDGGTASLDVKAEPQPSSGRLWGISGESLAGYTGLSDPGASVQADAVLTFAQTNDLRGVAWDLWGNLWTISSPTYGTRFLVVEPGDIAGNGAATVLHEVTSTALDSAQVDDLDTDAEGNLWVTVQVRDDGFAGILVFGVDDLRRSFMGSTDLTPIRSWTVAGAIAPVRTYFDADGGFYLADPGSDTVFHVASPGTISGATATAPADGELASDAAFTTFVDDGTGPRGLSGPLDMALDGTGLWVLYNTSAIVAHVSRSANGEVQSSFTYDLGVSALPSGMVRDGGNGIWVSGDPQTGAGDLQRFDPATGLLDRQTTLPDLPTPVQLAFDPPVPLPE